MAPVLGYWGPPTATIDWCETNYEFSYYIAEMTNTLSNFMMILPSIWGMSEVVIRGFEKKFIACYLLLLIVGLGSWAFHMTLLYQMQLFDELPMVWGTCVLVYCLSEVQRKPITGQIITNKPLFIGLAAFASIFTLLYLLWPQPYFQHFSFGLLVLTSFGLEIKLVKLKGCSICKKLFIVSTFIYFFGFFLWNIDKIFCGTLQSIRNSASTILNPVTQLHGWWHIMAGYATYLQVIFTIHATYDFRHEIGNKLVPNPLLFGLHWEKEAFE